MVGLRGLKLSLTLILFSQCALTQGVNPSEKTSDASQEAAIVQQISTSVRLENDGTGVVESMLRAKMLTQAGAQQFGLLTFNYQKNIEVLDVVSVSVRKPDGTVVETPQDSIQDTVADVSHDAPFFTRMREKHVPVKSLGAGDVLEYRIKETFSTALIPNQFWYEHDFTTQGVVLDEELKIDVPKSRAILLKSDKIKPSVTEQGDRRIYQWKTSHASTKEKIPPVLAGHLPPSGVELSSFASWAEFGKWMGTLYQDRAVPTPEITAKAQQLTKNAKTEEDKIKGLYNYVSLQFRYTGIAIGPGRWQPHTAAEVYSNEFGDCKDKHTLMAAMLKAIGITAYPALVNTSRVLDAQVPSPAQFDHVMTYIPRENGPIWLDVTQEVAPYGYIVFAMQDKQGLILDGDHSRLEPLPKSSIQAWEEFHADTTLSADGTLDGELTREARGDAEMVIRGVFRRVGPAKYRDLAQSISYASGFAGSVSDVEIGPTDDTSIPFKLKYHYNRKDFGDWPNRRITTPMPPLGIPAISQEPEHAKDAIVLGQPSQFRYYSKVKLPTGYSADLPANVDLSRPFADYHVKYDFKDGVLYAERSLTVKQAIVQPDELESYQSFRKSVEDDLERYIVLNAGGERTASAHVASPEAIQLVQQARNAFNMRDMPGAIQFMQRALEKDPKLENGWMMLGVAQMATGQTDDGIASMKKQLDATPGNFAAYRGVGTALERARKYDQALPVWRKLLSLDPENTEALTHLGFLENELKRYNETIADLEPAAGKHPKDTQLAYELSEAYFKIGNVEKGLALARKSVEEDPTADKKNSIAYLLADSNVELEQSLTWAKEAVAEEEAQRQDTKVESITLKDVGHANTLGAYWDTLGWVYFRKGNYVEAEKYLRAAWALLETYDPGSHLAETYEKLGKKQLAAKTWAQAYVASGREVEKARARVVKLTGSKVAADRMIADAGQELSQSRTLKISVPGVEHTSSEFWVLLSPGKVDAVRLLSADNSKVEKILLTTKFNEPFPSQDPVTVARKGIVFCSGGPTCDVVLYPLSTSNP